MRHRSLLAATALFALATPVHAQDTQAADEAESSTGDIVVTARKREETLLDVPVAASAITGALLEERGINSVREAAALTPGLNINSDGAGRAFVAIRGVGVTLVQSVQPGVGLFIDGIYQPNTSYLNNPLNDVERIEVLRGPQGTLYGKNTLGGAINVISRQPGNDFEGRIMGSSAGPDQSWMVAGSLSGPIVTDKLAVRVGVSHRQQDGFIGNVIVGGNANALNTDSINATIRATPSEDVAITIKGYYDWVDGNNVPYSRVAGPTAYSRRHEFNALNRVLFRYRGVSAKLELPIDAINTEVSVIGSYDARNGRSPDSDVDFGPLNFARANGRDRLRTSTAELRFDTQLSDTLSSLVGLFYSRETTRALDVTTIVPAGIVRTTNSATKADTYAVFGTLFWKPLDAFEVALGLRYDHEDRRATGSIVTVIPGLGTVGGAVAPQQIKSNEVQPKLTLTRNWSDRVMSYASVARGYRGGGFNAPTAPIRTYTGDSAWTYEVGTKFQTDDRRFTLSGALFFSDYKDYIGLNSIAPAAGGGLVTVDLNTGDVESYGLELEALARPVEKWTLRGGLTLMHARITDDSAYTAITGRTLSSDRLTFQPDTTANLYSDYDIPVGDGDDRVTLTAGMTYKGKRLAATLNQTTPTFLKGYALFNAAINYRAGPLEVAVFANNIFKKKFFESYIEKTTLQLAGLPASDLGIIGDLRRVGVRASLKF
jgi:iron complex outermembrane recepter protein